MAKDSSLDRRAFLKYTGAVGLGLSGLGLVAGCARRTPPPAAGSQGPTPPGPSATPAAPAATKAPASGGHESIVAHITDRSVQPSPGQLKEEALLRMLDKGLRDVTGEQSADAGWKSLFASDDVVAIKVNTISRSVFTQPAVALAVAQRLMDVGVKPGNIIIWDRSVGELVEDGYVLENRPGVVQVHGVEAEWENEPTQCGSFRGKLAKILTQQCSALINLPVLKNHGASGVTLALKNHYGSHHNPYDHHGNECDPFIADLNAIDAIKNKTRLVICDATRGCFEGGPGADNPKFVWEPNAILVSPDPVAHDAYGTKLLDDKRRSMGLPGVQPKHVATAAARGLGTNDLARVSVVTTELT